MQIAIIDYGSGNIHSVKKALEFVAPTDNIVYTNDINVINNADKIVFPGQGSMGSCMKKLKKYKLITTIKKNAKIKPFLGICLGLQLLFDSSEESNTKGLGIIDGVVNKFSSINNLKIPHMGWNTVQQKQDHPLWHKIPNNSYFYSVHSYFVSPTMQNTISATSYYGKEFACVVAKNNIFAMQFHPEKSTNNGLQLLRNFVNWRF